tara:strand:+ start:808 stop:1023 length:216 start_codon:yes stop_codon:yes gene_type:complete
MTNTYEQIMYDKILAHANCMVELDMNYPDEQHTSAIEIAKYHDGENVAIECSKCNEVIIDFDNPGDGEEIA